MIADTLDKARAERDQLMRNYRIAKKAQLLEFYEDPVFGERFRLFIVTLSHFNIQHADKMTEYVETESRKWLAAAPINIRYAALSAINDRIMRIRENAGLAVIDDPLPGEDPSVFMVCKEVLKL